ncbi:hypothetical protein OCL06_01120 [Alteromonas sp. ASW11-19]|uniref:Uncharacterized protein n=1 Tax=Alteromonas salexigens TaxID=2982530 RepID=A0ABT2VK51_9ALTE|nr:hypothetical protein [Alteromonas salexigens]MCU7553193.1 hypothetical protein [Alteromonas salexigens]
MTAQIPEKLTNNMREVSFDDYALFAIGINDPKGLTKYQGYPLKHTPDSAKYSDCTACWRGFVANYELTPAGEIQLVKFEYPLSPVPSEPDEVHEILKGDFWLELRKGFYGDKLFVPFKNGKIITDSTEWVEVCMKTADPAPKPVNNRALFGICIVIALLVSYYFLQL